MASIKYNQLKMFPHEIGVRKVYWYPPTDCLYVFGKGASTLLPMEDWWPLPTYLQDVVEMRDSYFSSVSAYEAYVITYNKYGMCDDFVDKAKVVLKTLARYRALDAFKHKKIPYAK